MRRLFAVITIINVPWQLLIRWEIYTVASVSRILPVYPLANLSKLFWGDYYVHVLFIQLNKITFFHSWFALCPTAGVDFKNSYDEWCILMQKAQDSARCLLKEYDDRFAGLKVLVLHLVLLQCKFITLINICEQWVFVLYANVWVLNHLP